MNSIDRPTLRALWILQALAFSVLLSSTVTYICLAGLVLFSFSKKHLRGDLRTLSQHPLALATLALLAWIILSMFWSDAAAKNIRGQSGRYLPLLIAPITLVLLNRPGVSTQAWKRIWIAFVASMALTVFLTYVNAVWPIRLPWDPDRVLVSIFRHYIIQGSFTALAVAACLSFAWSHGSEKDLARSARSGSLAGSSRSTSVLRAALCILAVVSAWSIVDILPGKTGLLCLIAALVPAILILGNLRIRLTLFAIVVSITTILILIPNTPRDELRASFITLQDPAMWDRPSPEGFSELPDRLESTLLRAKFALTAWRIGTDHPVVGAGSGAYKAEFCQRTGPAWCQVSVANSSQPHNQFLLLFAEQGMLGLGLLVIWCLVILKATKSMSTAQRYLAVASTTVFVVHSLLDSTLRLQTEGIAYPLLLAAVVGKNR